MVDNGQSERAFELNRRHRAVASYMNSTQQVGWSYFFKARMHDTRNESDSVIDAYTKGIEYFVKSKDIKGEGYCIGNLAAKYYELADYRKSISFYKKVLYLNLKQKLQIHLSIITA